MTEKEAIEMTIEKYEGIKNIVINGIENNTPSVEIERQVNFYLCNKYNEYVYNCPICDYNHRICRNCIIHKRKNRCGKDGSLYEKYQWYYSKENYKELLKVINKIIKFLKRISWN